MLQDDLGFSSSFKTCLECQFSPGLIIGTLPIVLLKKGLRLEGHACASPLASVMGSRSVPLMHWEAIRYFYVKKWNLRKDCSCELSEDRETKVSYVSKL